MGLKSEVPRVVQEWCNLLNHMVETNKLRPAVGAERFLPNFFS
jgi:hypothetical protein